MGARAPAEQLEETDRVSICRAAAMVAFTFVLREADGAWSAKRVDEDEEDVTGCPPLLGACVDEH